MATVAEITKEAIVRYYWTDGLTIAQIAEEYDVTPAAIWGRMKRWKIPRRTSGPLGRGKLDAEQVKVIRKRLAKGESCGKIAEDYPVSRQTISLIKQGIIWAHV